MATLKIDYKTQTWEVADWLESIAAEVGIVVRQKHPGPSGQDCLFLTVEGTGAYAPNAVLHGGTGPE